MFIPKKLSHIWIGPLQPPVEWMDTWKEKHPDWEYTLYDNQFLKSFPFQNQNLIDKYYALGLYAGVADIMRYEILYEFGGLIAPADSVCYHNTDELFNQACAYTVYENEFIRGKLVSPILACEAKNKFVGQLIEELKLISIDNLDEPWITTGNLFVAKMIEKYQPNITIFPSYHFVPIHYNGLVYQGNGKVYAKQLFGSTQASYKKTDYASIMDILYRAKEKREIKAQKKIFKQNQESKLNDIFNIDFSNR